MSVDEAMFMQPFLWETISQQTSWYFGYFGSDNLSTSPFLKHSLSHGCRSYNIDVSIVALHSLLISALCTIVGFCFGVFFFLVYVCVGLHLL